MDDGQPTTDDGHVSYTAAVIVTTVLNKSTETFTSVGDPSLIDRYCENDDNVVWVDVHDPNDADYSNLAEEFGFHPLSIEDTQKTHQRPKVEEYRGYYFIVLYEVSLVGEKRELELRELNIFLGKNYIVSVHSQPLRAVDTAARLWPSWLDRTDANAGLLAYLMIDAVVDDYNPLLDILSDRLDDLEDGIFGEFDPSVIEEIFLIKKQLLFLRRRIAPLREVFNTLLRREQPIFPSEIHIYFQDVFDHLIRVTEFIDTLRDMVGSTMDAYLSVSGNRMNMVMKRLTSMSAILMSVTLVAGIYGMNFKGMPELDWKYGYVIALSSMVVIGLVLYLFFRRIKWL
jgi:magnesium transporter